MNQYPIYTRFFTCSIFSQSVEKLHMIKTNILPIENVHADLLPGSFVLSRLFLASQDS